jgi:hypothetical protein
MRNRLITAFAKAALYNLCYSQWAQSGLYRAVLQRWGPPGHEGKATA